MTFVAEEQRASRRPLILVYQRRTLDRLERDRMLLLIRALLASTANAKRFISGGGLQMLLSLLTTVHMESERSACAAGDPI